ncbi:histidine phosphatase family protein [Peribacillus simplex]|uniref:histidine phosphatase family protein n=1 Tax=Peribacillus simplex TaxID=1478 RepID=UPI003D2A9EAD
MSKHKSGNILVVTHSVILKSLLMYVKGKSIKDLWAPPFIHDTSLTILEIKDGMHHLLSEGDVSHLNNVTSV